MAVHVIYLSPGQSGLQRGHASLVTLGQGAQQRGIDHAEQFVDEADSVQAVVPEKPECEGLEYRWACQNISDEGISGPGENSKRVLVSKTAKRSRNPFAQFRCSSNEHAAGERIHVLDTLKAVHADIPVGTDVPAVDAATEALCCILDQSDVSLSAQFGNCRNLACETVHVRGYDRAGIAVDQVRYLMRIYVAGLRLDICEYRLPASANHHVDDVVIGIGRKDDLLTRANQLA